jgi:2,4-diketo-3-deoxy-L-fuconate hydrolase
MKLIRCGEPGHEKPGIQLDNGARKDVSGLVRDFDQAFFADGGAERLRERIGGGLLDLPPADGGARTAAPIPRPGKIVAVGLNYRDHAAESGVAVPGEPVLFLKATTSFSGPNDPIVIPRGSTKTDYEVELGVVIGRTARGLAGVADAAACIAGYCVVNDVSERAFQLERGGQWDKGKGCDTFCPVGPWLVTPDEVGDPAGLALKLRVNGQKRQASTTAEMVFAPAFLVHYISQFMTLEPGDLVTTGTPGGVGQGMKPPRFLGVGDVIELEIAKLGRQRQVCVAWDAKSAVVAS